MACLPEAPDGGAGGGVAEPLHDVDDVVLELLSLAELLHLVRLLHVPHHREQLQTQDRATSVSDTVQNIGNA